LIARSPGGVTSDPTAKPESSALADKAKKDSPAVQGSGRTATPTAKPDKGSGSLSAGPYLNNTQFN
jgi:hypothetical protein